MLMRTLKEVPDIKRRIAVQGNIADLFFMIPFEMQKIQDSSYTTRGHFREKILVKMTG